MLWRSRGCSVNQGQEVRAQLALQAELMSAPGLLGFLGCDADVLYRHVGFGLVALALGGRKAGGIRGDFKVEAAGPAFRNALWSAKSCNVTL